MKILPRSFSPPSSFLYFQLLINYIYYSEDIYNYWYTYCFLRSQLNQLYFEAHVLFADIFFLQPYIADNIFLII